MRKVSASSSVLVNMTKGFASSISASTCSIFASAFSISAYSISASSISAYSIFIFTISTTSISVAAISASSRFASHMPISGILTLSILALAQSRRSTKIVGAGRRKCIVGRVAPTDGGKRGLFAESRSSARGRRVSSIGRVASGFVVALHLRPSLGIRGRRVGELCAMVRMKVSTMIFALMSRPCSCGICVAGRGRQGR